MFLYVSVINTMLMSPITAYSMNALEKLANRDL